LFLIANRYYDLSCGNYATGVCGSSTLLRGLMYKCNGNVNNTVYDFSINNGIIRNVQSTYLIGDNPTSNILSQTVGVSNWTHVLGNNPVKYVHASTPTHTPNALSVNVLAVPMPINAVSCTNPPNFVAQSLANLKAEYAVKEMQYNTYQALYAQLIDGGSTNSLIDNIHEYDLNEVNAIRSKMLGISPFVSNDALYELVNQHVLPLPYLLEVLLANPNATRNESFMRFLANDAPEPLPQFMIDLIENSWSGSSQNEILQQNMSNADADMTALRNEILIRHQTDTIYYNEDSILAWLQKHNSVRSEYEVVEHLLEKADYNQAEQRINTMETKFSLSAFELNEFTLYKEIYNFKKGLKLAQISMNELRESDVATLEGIAAYSQSNIAREMARSILCFFEDICFPVEIEYPSEASNRVAKQVVKKEIASQVKSYPNPADDFVVIEYKLTQGNQAKDLTIFDLTSKQVYQSALKGSVGHHVWHTSELTSGNFVYVVTSTSGEKYSGKIALVK
jgi:hypothetical protein